MQIWWRKKKDASNASSPLNNAWSRSHPFIIKIYKRNSSSIISYYQSSHRFIYCSLRCANSYSSRKKQTRHLLDSGCESSLIGEDIAAQLGLHGPKHTPQYGTFNGTNPKLTVAKNGFNLLTRDDKLVVTVKDAYTVPRLNIAHRSVY